MSAACINRQLQDIKQFVEQVTNVVYRQLLKIDQNAKFKVKVEDIFFTFIGHVLNRKITFSLLVNDAKRLRSKSPFALDRWIWERLEEFGVKIDPTNHYFKTVALLSDIHSKSTNIEMLKH